MTLPKTEKYLNLLFVNQICLHKSTYKEKNENGRNKIHPIQRISTSQDIPDIQTTT